MKLRLKGNEENSLRLRVSRSEMQRLLQGEPVLESVRFGAGEGDVFRYALLGSLDATEVTVGPSAGGVIVAVPEARLRHWSLESEVGIYETLTFSDGRTLQLVLEKDFACLDRADADNADTFDHPHASGVC